MVILGPTENESKMGKSGRTHWRRILIGKHGRGRPLTRPKHRWEDDIKRF